MVFIHHHIEQAIAASRRFPLSVLSALLLVGIALFLIEIEESDLSDVEPLLRLAFVSSLGIIMFAALRLFGSRNPLCIGGLILLGVYYYLLPDMQDPSVVVLQRHFFLIVLFFITLLWATFWNKRPSNELFWAYTKHIVYGLLIAIFFSVLLYLGISAALFAMNVLFNLGVSPKRYAQLWIITIGLFGVLYFLSQIPTDTRTLTIGMPTRTESIFTRYILTPISLIYFAILYLYTAKILLTLSFPKGILAWIIIVFSAVFIVTYLFRTPFWKESSQRFRQLLFIALLLQTFMLGAAIGMRVIEYGWSYNRYLVALLGLWLFGIALYFLLRKDASYRWMFISLSLVIAVSQVGPFSAYAVGKYTQQQRLNMLLHEYPHLSNETAMSVRCNIVQTLSYLHVNYGIDGVKTLLPDIVAKFEQKQEENKDLWFIAFATQELGFDYANSCNKEAVDLYPPFVVMQNVPHTLHISGFDYMIRLSYVPLLKRGISILDDGTKFELTTTSLQIEDEGHSIATVPIKEYLEELFADKKLRRILHHDGYLYDERLVYTYKDTEVQVKIFFLNLAADEKGMYTDIEILLLYKRLQ